MINIVLLLRHTPPSEIKLLPWSNVGSNMIESVMSFRSKEFFFNSLSIIEISNEISGLIASIKG